MQRANRLDPGAAPEIEEHQPTTFGDFGDIVVREVTFGECEMREGQAGVQRRKIEN